MRLGAARAGVRTALPSAAFDCILLTQTLQYLDDLDAALANLWGALRPGGVLLLTAPSLSRNDPLGHDHWRFTPTGLERLLTTTLPDDAAITVRGYGNAIAGAAVFLGLAVEDLGRAHIEPVDPAYPVIVGARVTRADVAT